MLVQSFVQTLRKLAEERSYARQVAAVAPLVAVQALVDVPRGWADKAVENAVVSRLGAEVVPSWRRGAGRALGRFPAVLTAPAFFSGIKDVKEGRKEQGVAKVLGASAIAAGLKGGTEAAVEHGVKDPKFWKKVRDVAGVRTVFGVGSGVLTAATVAGLMGKEKSDKGWRRVVLPALAGAAIGAARGGAERAWTERAMGRKLLSTSGGRRALFGAAAGRAVSGAAGAAVLSELARHFMKKQGGAQTAADLYAQVMESSSTLSDEELRAQVAAARARTSTPTGRAVAAGFGDEAARRVGKPQVGAVVTPGKADLAVLAAAMLAPTVVTSAVLSQSPSARDHLLSDAVDRMISNEGVKRIRAGLNFWGDIQPASPPQAFFVTIQPGDATYRRLSQVKGGTAVTGLVDAGFRKFISAREQELPEVRLLFCQIFWLSNSPF